MGFVLAIIIVTGAEFLAHTKALRTAFADAPLTPAGPPLPPFKGVCVCALCVCALCVCVCVCVPSV